MLQTLVLDGPGQRGPSAFDANFYVRCTSQKFERVVNELLGLVVVGRSLRLATMQSDRGEERRGRRPTHRFGRDERGGSRAERQQSIRTRKTGETGGEGRIAVGIGRQRRRAGNGLLTGGAGDKQEGAEAPPQRGAPAHA